MSIIFTKKNKKLIQILFKTGAISHYTLIKVLKKSRSTKKKTLKIFIKFTIFFFKSLPFYKNIRQVSTPSKTFTITNSTLKLVTPIFKTSIFILSTPLHVLKERMLRVMKMLKTSTSNQ
jgi:ribosomal protein S8